MSSFIVGRRLFTKDGRNIGNAIVVGVHEEGYGIFPIEMAVYLAQSLTGNKEYVEDPSSSS